MRLIETTRSSLDDSLLQVARCQTRVLGDSSKNARAQLFVVMKSKDEVRPSRMRNGTVRTRLTLDHPADSLQGQQEPDGLWSPASCSGRLERDVEKLRGRFPVLEAFRNNAECKGLNTGYRFITILAVAQDAGQSGNLGDPATVFFLFEFDRKDHVGNVPFRLASTKLRFPGAPSPKQAGEQRGERASARGVPPYWPQVSVVRLRLGRRARSSRALRN